MNDVFFLLKMSWNFDSATSSGEETNKPNLTWPYFSLGKVASSNTNLALNFLEVGLSASMIHVNW